MNFAIFPSSEVDCKSSRLVPHTGMKEKLSEVFLFRNGDLEVLSQKICGIIKVCYRQTYMFDFLDHVTAQLSGLSW